MAQALVFQQLFEPESSTYTYLLADPATHEAVLIDPVVETVERDLKLVAELGLTLRYVLDTHVHADHVSAAGEIRRRTGARTGVSEHAGVDCADLPLTDGQTLAFGAHTLTCLATPGHTDSCMSFLVGDRVFTGDALMIRGTGRTDFQQGSPDRLYDSITRKLFALPDDTLVYPAHDYRGITSTSIGVEKRLNPRVGAGRTLEQFREIMAGLKLADPKKIAVALPANLSCGGRTQTAVLTPHLNQDVPEIGIEDLKDRLADVLLVDVRTPGEYNDALGHLPGTLLKTLGPELDAFLDAASRLQEIVFVCRSGGRSREATRRALAHGFRAPRNLAGGMIAWNEARLPIVRD
jgi:glyoxylase-like metal-dependent hydrolase (beta-lactamase superfamily II)/rhodanese-related sulfurtransferase